MFVSYTIIFGWPYELEEPVDKVDFEDCSSSIRIFKNAGPRE